MEEQDFIRAYSEFMPAPRMDYPYERRLPVIPRVWRIPEVEEEYELKPGMDNLARQILNQIIELGQGGPAYQIAGHQRRNLLHNPYWPHELAARAGNLPHERFVIFLAISLSKTQDDKGRLRWTFFGSSEQGPEKAFWKSFFNTNGREIPLSTVIEFWQGFFSQVYDRDVKNVEDLMELGFRILPSETDTRFPYWNETGLPSWASRFLMSSAEDTRYLLTFRPFASLPETIREKYLAGRMHLIPFPGSLILWGMPAYRKLQAEMPFAMQLPLLRMVKRHNGGDGIKVPQSGWFHEKGTGLKTNAVDERLLINSYRRTHRWDRVRRHEDELGAGGIEDTIGRTLFSTDLAVLGLYNKPMARNSQLWTIDSHLLLDGPYSTLENLKNAAAVVADGGNFHYRFQFPAMRLGVNEIFWQRPLCAFQTPEHTIELLEEQPKGYFTVYRNGKPDLAHPQEMHPQILARETYITALRAFEHAEEHYRHQTAFNVTRLLDTFALNGKAPLLESFARRILKLPETTSINDWLNDLSAKGTSPEVKKLVNRLRLCVKPARAKNRGKPLTFDHTKAREFEEAWWNNIYALASGRYINKNNADCVRDPVTQSELKHHHRDLDSLADYLLERHHKSIKNANMDSQAFCGELPFNWRTDFDFPEFGGWQKDEEGRSRERDLFVVIPGKNRGEAVIMADHYDTAFMEDRYDKSRGGTGARIASSGADDDHSATATLLQAAPVFLELSRQGILKRDIWLVHLTGEEFPADCLGSRNLTQALIKHELHLSSPDKTSDLSRTKITGVYILDMIGHNSDYGKNIFQISPGRGSRSLKMAEIAHLVNEDWNAGTKDWNRRLPRRGTGPGMRSPDGKQIPSLAKHPALTGEVRLIDDPHSTLFNTDGQIFSDCGIPVILFMENYDIGRSGYHDTKDNMFDIDLDYGVALASIAIETVARTASTKV